VLRNQSDKYLFWAATTLIGLGSAFFHASLSFVGQTFDVLGMYLLATLVLLWSAQRRLGWSMRQRVIAYVLGNAALLTLLILEPALRRYVFAAVIVGVLFLERQNDPLLPGTSRRFLAWAAGLLAIGFLIWVLDITRTVCDPASNFQGHAAWHLCGAASALMIYLHHHQR
jgi:dihydroceramidase